MASLTPSKLAVSQALLIFGSFDLLSCFFSSSDTTPGILQISAAVTTCPFNVLVVGTCESGLNPLPATTPVPDKFGSVERFLIALGITLSI